jgi:hypothetical protein
MPRRKKQEVARINPLNVGTVAFIAIFLVAAISMRTPVEYEPLVTTLLVILGVIVAVFNITLKEEVNFLIAVTALVVILYVFTVTATFQGEVLRFIKSLIVGFGIGGLVIALAQIIKLGITK